MNQYQAEKRLCWAYALVSVLLLVSVISIAIPYHHWKATLDVCPSNRLENKNCDCIFFGISTTFQYFNGGHSSFCLYAIFAPLVAMAYAIVLAVFHMYRVCINNIGKYEDDKSTAMEEIEGEAIVVRTRSRAAYENDTVIHCWIPNACLAALFALYSLIHACIITHGFIKTCNEYRVYLVKHLDANGDQVAAIHFRLTCSSIFDYMDYFHKDRPDSRRGEFINTGASLQIAIVASWVSIAIWIFIVVLASKRAYKERNVLTCCGKY